MLRLIRVCACVCSFILRLGKILHSLSLMRNLIDHSEFQSDTHTHFHSTSQWSILVVRRVFVLIWTSLHAFQHVHYSYLYLMTSPEEQRHLFDQALSKLSVFGPVHLKEITLDL